MPCGPRSPARNQEQPRQAPYQRHEYNPHLDIRANGHSAIPRICEPVLTVLRETTTKESHKDHQEETRGDESGATTADNFRPINDTTPGVCKRTIGL